MARMARNLVAAALVCLVAMSALAPAALAAGPTTVVSPAKAVAITLYGRFTAPQGWGFGPNNVTQPGPAITVDKGDVITFTLFAGDNVQHNLVIDLNNSNVQDPNEPHSNMFSSATTSITFVYTADQTGTFQYICGIHGGGMMRGSFTVRVVATPPSDNTLLIVGGVVVVVVIVAVAGAVMMRRKKP